MPRIPDTYPPDICLQTVIQWLRSLTQLNEHLRRWCKYLNVRIYLTQLNTRLHFTYEGMSELFNEAFGKVFTKENLSDIPEARWVCPDKGDIGLL